MRYWLGRTRPAWAAAGVLGLLLARPAPAQEPPHRHDVVGAVEFPVSCSPEAAATFQRAVAMLHSFWFDEAERTFDAAAALDPRCGMAHWGRALVQLSNPFAGLPTPARVTAGAAAAARAAQTGAPTERERGYIDAVVALFDADSEPDARARMRRYEAAMQRLAAAHPADTEAAVFHALAVIANAPPTDLTFSGQKTAAAILNPLFEQHPDHPGLAHYIIHAFDSPPLAELGLHAARRYAEIAPAAPHALHMPSHIFTRLGHWDESITSNRAAADAEGTSPGRLHPLDYLVYAYLQQGRDADAHAALDEADALVRSTPASATLWAFNYAAMHARYAVERGDWAAAARLPMPPAATAPYIQAVTGFVRAVGAARSGDPAAGHAALGDLDRLHAAQSATGDAYWTRVIDVQRIAARAWVAHAEGRAQEALRLAGEAADLEATYEKHPVTPGPIMPARELLGELLLEHGDAAAALDTFRRALEREPNRARTLFGLGRAAELLGDPNTARAHYTSLLELRARADGRRDDFAAAYTFLGR